jgi:hypothetical protein
MATRTRRLRTEGEVVVTVVLREHDGFYPRKLEVEVDGTSVGTLTYTEQRYNLRRPVTAKMWTGRTSEGEETGHDSRQKVALASLLRAAGMDAAAEAAQR